ncbi:MAG: lysophospholipid acyltransferase family protein, partial [Microcystaceae cyanobacterium]
MTLSAAHFDPSELGKSKVSSRLMTLAQPLGEGLLNFYFSSIQVSGQEHIPLTGPVIVAPTHRSRWDALLIAWAIARRVSGRDLRFMVTTTEMTGIQGWFIRRLGGFPVDVKRPESSSLIYSVALLNQGEMLVIFPEGGIFREKQIQPLKRGVARIALEVLAQ